MKRFLLLPIALALACCAIAGANAGRKPFAVIVHKANKLDSLSRSQLNVIFLRKVSRWPWGAETFPIDLPDVSPVRRAFLETILNKSAQELAIYWIDQRVTRNVSAPIQAPDAAAVKALVASRPGAIGYIPAEAVDPTVKVIEVK